MKDQKTVEVNIAWIRGLLTAVRLYEITQTMELKEAYLNHLLGYISSAKSLLE